MAWDTLEASFERWKRKRFFVEAVMRWIARRADSKHPIFNFCLADFRVWVTSEARGSVSVGCWGSRQLSLFSGGGSSRRALSTPPPPGSESPPAPAPVRVPGPTRLTPPAAIFRVVLGRVLESMATKGALACAHQARHGAGHPFSLVWPVSAGFKTDLGPRSADLGGHAVGRHW